MKQYKEAHQSSLTCSGPFIIVVEISPSFVSISIVHAFCNLFCSSSSVGPCTTVATLLNVFPVGFSFNEVWVAHDSTLFLFQEYIDHDGEPQDFFTPGLWGGLPQRKFSTLSWSTWMILWILDKLKIDFSNTNQSRNIEAHTLLLTLLTS